MPCDAMRSSTGSVRDSGTLRALASGVPCVRIGAVLQQELYDLPLLGVRAFRAARARRMRGDVEKRRALSAVRRIHTSAALEETANGLRTPCANRTMQRRRARLVLALDIRACVEQELNH